MSFPLRQQKFSNQLIERLAIFSPTLHQHLIFHNCEHEASTSNKKKHCNSYLDVQWYKIKIVKWIFIEFRLQLNIFYFGPPSAISRSMFTSIPNENILDMIFSPFGYFSDERFLNFTILHVQFIVWFYCGSIVQLRFQTLEIQFFCRLHVWRGFRWTTFTATITEITGWKSVNWIIFVDDMEKFCSFVDKSSFTSCCISWCAWLAE